MAVGGQTRLQAYVDVSACAPEKLADSIIGVWKPLQVCWTSLCLQRKNSRIVLAPVLVGTDSLSLSLSLSVYVCMYLLCLLARSSLCPSVCLPVSHCFCRFFLVLIPFSLRFCLSLCLPHCSVCLCLCLSVSLCLTALPASF